MGLRKMSLVEVRHQNLKLLCFYPLRTVVFFLYLICQNKFEVMDINLYG